MASTTTAPTSDLALVLDMFQNLNWSQIGDAIQAKSASPVTTIETVANAFVEAAAIAGVPFAGTAEAVLPIAETIVGMAAPFLDLFGGANAAPAIAATITQNASDAAATTQASLAATAGTKPATVGR